jgi:DNA-binding transcriptional LysR family regulator
MEITGGYVLNLRQVEMFKAIFETGSITRAAAALNVSQPAVTKSLQLLEHDLGLTLFTRTPKGLVPSHEARAFYTEVERSFSGLASLSRFARDLRSLRHERLVVNVIPALSHRWMPEVVASFLAAYPEASLSFHASSSPDTAQMVGRRQIDLGIAQSRVEDPSIERIPLMQLPVVCIIPADMPLAKEAVITPGMLRGQSFIGLSRQDIVTAQLERHFADAGVELRPRIEAALALSVRALVARGLGVGLIDAESAALHPSPTTVIRAFRPLVAMPIYLLRLRDHATSLVEERFVEHVRRFTDPAAISGEPAASAD